MTSYVVLENVSVSACNGTLPDATEPSFGKNWPRGSVFEPCSADAESLLRCNAIKLAPKDGSDALVDTVLADPLAGIEPVIEDEPEAAVEPSKAVFEAVTVKVATPEVKASIPTRTRR